MKAISIKQPWAWAFLHGKEVENRNWRFPPKYRGEILIQASKTFDKKGYQWIVENKTRLFANHIFMPHHHRRNDGKTRFEDGGVFNIPYYQMGGIVAKGNLIGVVQTNSGHHRLLDHHSENEARLIQALKSPWYFGPMGLVIVDVVPVPFVPCKGQLGIFNVEVSL